MSLQALQSHLLDSFHAPAAAGLDAVFKLAIADDSLLFRIRQETLEFDLPEGTRPDATFMFEDIDTAWALLSGQADGVDAFMQGQFKSDGYLMWAFALMAMFRSSSLPVTPTE